MDIEILEAHLQKEITVVNELYFYLLQTLKGSIESSKFSFLRRKKSLCFLRIMYDEISTAEKQESVFLLDLQQFGPTILYYKGEDEHQQARSRINSSSHKVPHHTVL